MKKLIVSHDAGAAEIIACWARRQNKSDFVFCLEGPAAKIFPRRIGDIEIKTWEDVSKSPGRYSVVLTGTSWASDLERRALLFAHEYKIPSATFLDHWVNYRKRFETSDGIVTPDELYVYDEIGKEIATRELKHPNIKIIDNPYWEDMVLQIQALDRVATSGLKILYCTQPVKEPALRMFGREDGYGYDEFAAMNEFLRWVQEQGFQVEALRLRLHPSETAGKYDEIVRASALGQKFSVSENIELVDDVAWADVVVGCDTMAMVIGLKANRRVLCSIPKGGNPLQIPLPGIERLFL